MRIKKNICGILTAGILLTTAFGYHAPVVHADEAKSSDRVIVSLGDSYSSGEGIEPFYGQDDPLDVKVKNQDWLAHRSTGTWSGMLKLPGVEGTMSEHRGENWFFVAASGATTYNLESEQDRPYNKTGKDSKGNLVHLSDKKGEPLDPQMKIFEKLGGKQVDYVTLTMGGNDIGFKNIVIDVVKGVRVLNYGKLREHLREARMMLAENGETRRNLKEAYIKISEATNKKAKILVAGYPKLFDQTGKGIFSTRDEAKWINEAVHDFNNRIKEIISECWDEGWPIYYVDVEEKFNGHEAYSDDPYIREIIPRPLEQDLKDIALGSDYSMHPNEKGAKVYAECVQAKIDELEKEAPVEPGSEKKPLQLDTKSKEMLRDLLPFINSDGRIPYMSAHAGDIFTLNESDEMDTVLTTLNWNAGSISQGTVEENGIYYKYSVEDVCKMLNLISKKDLKDEELASKIDQWQNEYEAKNGALIPGRTKVSGNTVLSPQEAGGPLSAGIDKVDATTDRIDVHYYLEGAGEGVHSYWVAHFSSDDGTGLFLESIECEKEGGATDIAPSDNTESEHRYEIIREAIDWDVAKAYCESKGGHLATITSEKEQKTIEKLNEKGENLWIGGYRDDNGTQWKWVTGETWSYTNWGDGEPNNSDEVIGNENRVALWGNTWNDLNNASVQQVGFVCEWD